MTPNIRTSPWLTRLGSVGVGAALAVGSLAVAPAAADASLSAHVSDDTLAVSGGDGDDRITLRLVAGAPGTLEVSVGDAQADGLRFDRATFSRVVVSAGNGDDQVSVDQQNGAFGDEALTVIGGNGDDSFAGGDGAETFLGGRGDDRVDGNRAADTAHLGAGDDSFRWDPGDGSDVVEGGSGSDTLEFIGAAGAENMRLSRNGTAAVFLRDAGNIRMDLDRVERLDLTTLGGVDTFLVDDLTGTGIRAVDVDLAAPAGGGDGLSDTVTVNGTPNADVVDVAAQGGVEAEGLAARVRIVGSDTVDLLQVNTLDGNDQVDVADDVAGLIRVGVDLGSGQA